MNNVYVQIIVKIYNNYLHNLKIIYYWIIYLKQKKHFYLGQFLCILNHIRHSKCSLFPKLCVPNAGKEYNTCHINKSDWLTRTQLMLIGSNKQLAIRLKFHTFVSKLGSGYSYHQILKRICLRLRFYLFRFMKMFKFNFG